MINEHLDPAINDRDTDRMHRIRNPRNSGEKPRPKIIKLLRCNDRKKTFDSKKKLNGKKVAITESLMISHMKKMSKARKKHKFKNVWTSEKKFIQECVGKKLFEL